MFPKVQNAKKVLPLNQILSPTTLSTGAVAAYLRTSKVKNAAHAPLRFVETKTPDTKTDQKEWLQTAITTVRESTEVVKSIKSILSALPQPAIVMQFGACSRLIVEADFGLVGGSYINVSQCEMGQTGVDIVCSANTALPFLDECVDAIVVVPGWLNHCQNLDLALSELHRISKPQGRFICWGAPAAYGSFNHQGWRNTLTCNRFTVLGTESFGELGPFNALRNMLRLWISGLAAYPDAQRQLMDHTVSSLVQTSFVEAKDWPCVQRLAQSTRLDLTPMPLLFAIKDGKDGNDISDINNNNNNDKDSSDHIQIDLAEYCGRDVTLLLQAFMSAEPSRFFLGTNISLTSLFGHRVEDDTGDIGSKKLVLHWSRRTCKGMVDAGIQDDYLQRPLYL